MKFLRRPLLTFSALLALAAVFLPHITFAQPAARAERPAQQRTDEGQSNGQGVLRLLPADAVSDKEIAVGDRKIAYTATAGTLPLFDQNGERTASVYYTAYVAKGADAGRRPITFAFNGGPGAASVYLNLGIAGPRIVDFGGERPDGASAKLSTTRIHGSPSPIS